MRLDLHTALRSFLSIGCGFLLAALLIGAAAAVLRRWGPQGWTADPAMATVPVMVTNLTVSSASAAAGGALTALMATPLALPHALMLAIVILIVSAIAAVELPPAFRVGYRVALLALPALAALGGGILVALFR